MSEAELYGIKQRMQQGRLAKAERGELAMRLPMGYLRRPSGEVIKDPDEQARSAVGLIFELFERVQTAGAVYRKLLAEGVQMPCRLAAGPRKGDLDWRQPSLATVREVLRNPVYAGAFVYGRRRTDARRQQPGRLGTGRIATPREQWQVLLQDRLPAYISWEQYEQNQRQLRANNTRNKGVVRHGPSLLSGLLICGLCGRRLTTRYVNKGTSHRYCCEQLWVLRKGPACQSLVGDVLDARVAELVLAALEPAALELSIQVAGNHDAERRRLDEHWRLRLEKARYDSERARRQYEAVEPENRLVARTLERAWEDALRAAQALEQEHTRFLAARPSALSASDRDTIRALAQSIPTLWHAPTTTAADRQSFVRQLIDKVVVTVIDGTEHVALEVHWHGGHTTADSLVRPVRRLDQLRNGEELTRRAVELFQDGHTGAEVAEVLSSEGWRPASRRPQFTRDMVYALIQRHGRVARRRRPGITERQPNEWTIIELSEKIGMPRPTLQVWIRDSDLPRRRIGNGRGTWLVTADAAEISRLKERRAQRLAKNRDISS